MEEKVWNVCFEIAGIESLGEKELVIQVERAIAKEWYKRKEWIMAEMQVELKADLSEEIVKIEFTNPRTEQTAPAFLKKSWLKELGKKKIIEKGFTHTGEKTYTCGGVTKIVQEYKHNATGMEFVYIPGGTYQMGVQNGENPNLYTA
jgi:formylglycine-generating enzyme required for sulfatase activity